MSIVLIPTNLNIQSLGMVVRAALSSETINSPTKTIVFDFNKIGFADVAGSVGLGNLFKYLSSMKIESQLINVKESIEVIRYLDDAAFFEDCIGHRLSEDSYTRSTTMPYYTFRNDEYNSYLFQQLTPWIAREVNLSEETISTIRTALEEVFHNVLYHSGVNAGCTLSQHFPNRKRIDFALSDYGRGIPQLVRTVREIKTDSGCIREACKQGFTTKTNVVNRGVGLHLLIQQVVLKNNGRVQIRSGYGDLAASKRGAVVTYELTERAWSYPGTLVHATLRTDTLESLEADVEREVFTW